jgi:VanZ family protein
MIFWIRMLLRYAPVALAVYWTALFIGTHLPITQQKVEPVPYFDKWLHLAGFAGLAFLAATAWRARRSGRPLGSVQYGCLLAGMAAYAAVDELSQLLPFVRRNADLGDWFADVIGAAIGLALYTLARMMVHGFGWRVENGPLDRKQAGREAVDDATTPCAVTAVE